LQPLPPKHSTKSGKFDSEFLDYRRAGLERFMQRIVAHPVLSHNPSVKVVITRFFRLTPR
jgi:hypothetical protein